MGRGAGTSQARIAARVVLAAMTAAASMGVCGAGSSAADSAALTLQYTCSLPPFPDQAMTARLTWNAPNSVLVGQTTPVLPINATATMGAIVTQGLDLVGAATVEGRVDATGVVVAPEGHIGVTVPLTVPRTDVPAAGPITVGATGMTPVFMFRQPGHATITVGSGLAVHLTPRGAIGGPTAIGQIDASCTLNPGQNNVLSSFEITAPRTTSVPTTASTVGGSTGSTGSGARGTVTAGPSSPVSSRTAPVSVSATAAAGMGRSGSAPASATGTRDPAFATTASTAKQSTVDLRLVGSAVPAAGIGVFGYVWWLRRRRGGQGH